MVTEVFALPRPELDVRWWYEVDVFAVRPGPVEALGGFAVDVRHGLDVLEHAGTVVLVGAEDVTADPPPDLVAALVRAHERGARLVSICSGAFVLAATGLLDGRRVATHWRYADLLARRFPRVNVDASVLFVDEGDVLSSAGTAAGIDLCLHLVRADHGAGVANRVARRMVVAPYRDGGQAQFVESPVPAPREDDEVATVMAWALRRLPERIEVADMAAAAHWSPRTLTRRFTAATGVSPARWLATQRVAASLPLLERGALPADQVGRAVGIGDPVSFRRHFRRVMGVTPSQYRQRYARAQAL